MSIFNYNIADNTIIFRGSLTSPCVFEEPRNHESLFFVTKGDIEYIKNDISEVVKFNNVGYIKKGSIDISKPYNCDKVSYIAVNFNINLDSVPLPLPTSCGKINTSRYEELFIKALETFQLKHPGYMAICNGIIMQIIGLLFEEQNLSREEHKKHNQINDGIKYLTENFDNPDLKISELSKICKLSERHFRRIFYDLYKKMPYEYLIDFRLGKSKILLENTSKAITEIAFECGFSDVYSFSHSFTNHFNISPNKYRDLR